MKLNSSIPLTTFQSFISRERTGFTVSDDLDSVRFQAAAYQQVCNDT